MSTHWSLSDAVLGECGVWIFSHHITFPWPIVSKLHGISGRVGATEAAINVVLRKVCGWVASLGTHCGESHDANGNYSNMCHDKVIKMAGLCFHTPLIVIHYAFPGHPYGTEWKLNHTVTVGIWVYTPGVPNDVTQLQCHKTTQIATSLWPFHCYLIWFLRQIG